MRERKKNFLKKQLVTCYVLQICCGGLDVEVYETVEKQVQVYFTCWFLCTAVMRLTLGQQQQTTTKVTFG